MRNISHFRIIQENDEKRLVSAHQKQQLRHWNLDYLKIIKS